MGPIVIVECYTVIGSTRDSHPYKRDKQGGVTSHILIQLRESRRRPHFSGA